MQKLLLSRAGWLALTLSLVVHVFLFALFWLLAAERPAITADLPVDMVAVLSDNLLMPGDSASGKTVDPPGEETQEHPQPAIIPVTMPPDSEPPPRTPRAVTGRSP